MAAFRRCGNDGLIPQLRHGGNDMFEFAVAGSKFEGTGLENEQIVQTHVALLGLGVLDPDLAFGKDLEPRCIGEALELRGGEGAASCAETSD